MLSTLSFHSLSLSVFRMIPPSSKSILVNNLAAGTQYALCVLAIYDDLVTSLTATRVVGCIRFTTDPQYLRCHFMQSQFLGGTIVVIIGGIIVASVLSFIVFLIVRYRVCNQGDEDKVGVLSIALFFVTTVSVLLLLYS